MALASLCGGLRDRSHCPTCIFRSHRLQSWSVPKTAPFCCALIPMRMQASEETGGRPEEALLPSFAEGQASLWSVKQPVPIPLFVGLLWLTRTWQTASPPVDTVKQSLRSKHGRQLQQASRNGHCKGRHAHLDGCSRVIHAGGRRGWFGRAE
jgi:hypothetical protein